MIRRFNHHSTMVLRACDTNSESNKSTESSVGSNNSALTKATEQRVPIG
jgi:hypothetical protein